MKTLKKTLCLVLAVVMAVGVLVLPASAADYKDVTSDTKYAEAINALTKYGIVKGKSTTENVFDPDGDVTRAEVTAMLYRIMTGDTDEKNIKNSESYATKYFPKDKFTAWQLGPVGYSANAGLVKGKYEGFFDPDGKVTGYELLAIMLRAVGYGKNGEYEGALWQQHAIADATQIGFLKSVVGDMKDNLTRGQVAQIIYNAIAAPMVTYYQGAYSAYKDVAGRPVAPNTPGATLNPSLVNYTSTTSAASNAKSVWGIPSATKTETVTFNNVIKTVVVSTTETPVDLKLFETWDAVTECNVIKGIGVDGDHYADTYTNGIYNKGTQKLEALDTVNKIGHEGRHTLVYANPAFDSSKAETSTNPKYLIVYIDTFLATVTKTWEKVTDPAGHIIKAAGANVRVWFNKEAEAWEIGTSSYTTPYNYIDLTVDGTYTVGQKLGVNLTTVADESGKTTVFNVMAPTLPNKNYKADPVTGKYPAGPQIEVDPTVPASPYTLTKVTATIETITRDSSKGAMNYNYAIGFVAGGTQYFYNNTYIKTVLQGDAVGKTYDIWLDSQGNVLDLALSTPGGGYGVVTNTVVKQVNSKNYVVDYTILLPDGTETTISVGKDSSGKAFTNEYDAKVYAAGMPEDTLVHYIGTLNYYYLQRYNGFTNNVNIVESGRAAAIDLAYDWNPVVGDGYTTHSGLLVNDETVFFVAEYLPDLTTDVNGDYDFQRYTIYTGFKTIPDLGIDAGASRITVQSFVIGEDGEPRAPGLYDYAKYVLVLYSTKQTVPPKAINTVNYAYLITNDVYVQQGRNTYTYSAVVNGEKTTLTFALSQGKTETGLYTYNQSVNGDGYSNLYLLDGSENAGLKVPYKSDFELDAKTYSYANGVLTETDGIHNHTFYYTVDDNCAVYLVNPTTGVVTPSNLSALDVYGKTSSIWYQLNEKGYIDLIYITESQVYKPDDGADDSVYPGPSKSVYPLTVTIAANTNRIRVPLIADRTKTVTSETDKAVFYVTTTDEYDPDTMKLEYYVEDASGVDITANVSVTITPVNDGTIEVVVLAKGLVKNITVTLSILKIVTSGYDVVDAAEVHSVSAGETYTVKDGGVLTVGGDVNGTVTVEKGGKVVVNGELNSAITVADGGTATVEGIGTKGKLTSNGTTTVNDDVIGTLAVEKGTTTVNGDIKGTLTTKGKTTVNGAIDTTKATVSSGTLTAESVTKTAKVTVDDGTLTIKDEVAGTVEAKKDDVIVEAGTVSGKITSDKGIFLNISGTVTSDGVVEVKCSPEHGCLTLGGLEPGGTVKVSNLTSSCLDFELGTLKEAVIYDGEKLSTIEDVQENIVIEMDSKDLPDATGLGKEDNGKGYIIRFHNTDPGMVVINLTPSTSKGTTAHATANSGTATWIWTCAKNSTGFYKVGTAGDGCATSCTHGTAGTLVTDYYTVTVVDKDGDALIEPVGFTLDAAE